MLTIIHVCTTFIYIVLVLLILHRHFARKEVLGGSSATGLQGPAEATASVASSMKGTIISWKRAEMLLEMVSRD